MLLFVSPSNMYVRKVIIPLERVYNISVSDCSIIINYDAGELIWLDGDKYEKKIESIRITFDSPDAADEFIRNFYKSVYKGVPVFHFGNFEDNEKSKKKVIETDVAASVEVLPSESQDNLLLEMLSR